MPECPDCNGTDYTTAIQPQQLTVSTTVMVPVLTCSACGCQWTTHEAEAIRDAEILTLISRLH